MENLPSSENSLPFPPFVVDAGMGAGNISAWKAKVMRFISPGAPKNQRSPGEDQKKTSGLNVQASVVSKYDVDLFGRPRPLSRIEITLYAYAWPVLLGFIVGFGLAIALVALNNSPGQASKSHPVLTHIAQVEDPS